MARDTVFVELAKAKIQEHRNVVVSECSKGGFTIAQQLEADEGNRKTYVFLSGAIHVDDVNGLYNMRDALNVAISEYEKSVKDFEQPEEVDPEEDWDE